MTNQVGGNEPQKIDLEILEHDIDGIVIEAVERLKNRYPKLEDGIQTLIDDFKDGVLFQAKHQ